MEIYQFAAAVLCVAVGLSLGLLGGGGSVLMVPLFVYVAKVPVDGAIAMSLLVAGAASALGAFRYFQQGFVDRRLVVLFSVPGVAASLAGARVTERVPPEHLLLMFGGLMMLIALILYRRSSDSTRADGPVVCHPDAFLCATVGAGIGFLTGFLGVGGGFLIVPAIALLMKCSIYTAIGTSLAVIFVNSSAGLVGHLAEARLDGRLSALFLAATMAGAAAGTRLQGRFTAATLQKGFAGLIFLVGTFLAAHNCIQIIGR